MKLPNDLIKSTDYDTAKDRIIHEFECVNGKVVQHYVLGGEHELTSQEIIDCLNALATIDCDLQTAYAYIKGQQDKISDLEAKLAESEKSNEYFSDRVEKADKEIKENYRNYNKLVEEYNELKQQLFQSGLKTLEEIKLSEQRKKMLEDLSTKNWELEQQLAEKEKEIESNVGTIKSLQNGLCVDLLNKEMTELRNQHQDKILFAIEKLEKVKEYIHGKYLDETWHNKIVDEDREDTHDYIDNQIEELKKELNK